MPERVRRLTAGRPVRPVWRNERGGLTFHDPGGDRYIKTSPPGGPDLAVEVGRLDWVNRVAPSVPVPRVLAAGRDEDGDWLVTAACPGRSAVHPFWRDRPALAARAIGRGLRRLHEVLPVADCPFDWTASARLRRVPGPEKQHAGGWHPDHRHLPPDRAVDLVLRPPPVDRLVVCHGDACAPNTLLADDGEPSAHVDLGRLGVADRWSDLAIATWSFDWNFGPGFQHEVLAGYGIAPDPTRTAYYRLLWDLSPD